MRTCNKCGQNKDDSCFGPSHPHCRECKNIAEKERRARNIEYVRAYDRARYAFKRRDERLEYCKEYHESGGKSALRKNKTYTKVPLPENPKGISINEQQFRAITAKFESRKGGVNGRVRRKLKDRFRAFMFLAKKSKWRKLIGADVDFVKCFLEAGFSRDMNWENHGKLWHIDHYVPISHFDLDDDFQVKCAFNWRNLRPLSAVENLKKHDKLPKDYLSFVENLKREILNEP